jgi:hypothetical protein
MMEALMVLSSMTGGVLIAAAISFGLLLMMNPKDPLS